MIQHVEQAVAIAKAIRPAAAKYKHSDIRKMRRGLRAAEVLLADAQQHRQVLETMLEGRSTADEL